MGLNISIAPETILHLNGFQITNSIFSSLIIISSLIIFALIVSSRQFTLIPNRRSLQNFLETIVQGLISLYSSILGPTRARQLFPLLTTYFIFILISNWFGILPGVGSIGIWEVHEGERILIPLFRSPSADVNNTLALALIAMTFVQVQGVKIHNIGYFKKFINLTNPIKFFIGLIELVSEVAKVVSFAFRLFGNIFAGEVLLLVMGTLIAIPIAGNLLTIPFLVMEIFVGFIQSLVFVMLILAFTATATAKQH